MQCEYSLDPEPTVVDGTVGRLAFTQSGTKGPALLLVHGCPGSRRDFRWLTHALSQWARVIAVDMPGYGAARPTLFPATTGGRAAYLAEVLDKANIKRAIVVSHSFGSSAAVDLAVRYNERVEAIALLAPAGAFMHRGLRRFKGRRLLHAIARIPYFGSKALLNLKTGMVRAGFSRHLEPDEILRMLELLEQFDFTAYGNLLNKVQRPVFVGHALNDPFIERWIVEDLVSRMGNAHFQLLCSGGHNIQKTMGVEISAALAEWVAKL